MKPINEISKSKNSCTNVRKEPLNYINLASKRTDKIAVESRKINFKEIYQKPNDKDLQDQASRCLDCGNPYCEWKCPLHNMIPNWLELSRDGHFEKAAELMHETNPLPEICGRVCPQDRLCEQACTLQTGFGAVTIGEVEKVISDKALANKWRPDLSGIEKIDKKVSIVGAGPAGLGCAELLARNGVNVIVYDRYPEIGGLMTFGIPGFKLEKSVIAQRREFLQDIGIEFKLNINVGRDITIEEIRKKSDSVFLGLGCYKSLDGSLIGRDHKGVLNALDYLIGNISQQENYNVKQYSDERDFSYQDLKGKSVIVLGGGDTAMDCVRSAVRQNAKKVSCVYRKSKEAMPGSPREVENAIEEGVDFIFGHQPVEIVESSGSVSGVKFEISNSNSDGIMEQAEAFLDADVVIIAFGFAASPENWFSEIGLETEANGLVKVGDSKETNLEDIFVGGDMVSGADLVVTAIAQGRDAARSILDRFDCKNLVIKI